MSITTYGFIILYHSLLTTLTIDNLYQLNPIGVGYCPEYCLAKLMKLNKKTNFVSLYTARRTQPSYSLRILSFSVMVSLLHPTGDWSSAALSLVGWQLLPAVEVMSFPGSIFTFSQMLFCIQANFKGVMFLTLQLQSIYKLTIGNSFIS